MKKINRINALLKSKSKGLLSVYYTAGYPALDDTLRIGVSLADSGADLIEIGIPFSDPVADGPVIQESSKQALDNGMTLTLLLQQVRELRSRVNAPILLMGYFNPIMQFGVEKFLEQSAEAGVDGLIIPDLPLAEYQELYQPAFARVGLLNIFLIAPTTSTDRIKAIDDISEGFIYAVSSSSTTGAKQGFGEEQRAYFEKLKHMNHKNPFLIGFGISNHDTFSTACQYGVGAIMGSAFISLLKESRDFETDIPKFVKSLRS